MPGHPIKGVTLSNLRFTFPGGGAEEDYEREVEELADQYPEAVMFGTLPAYGFYCRHVDGLRLENLDFELESADQRPTLMFEDVQNLDISGLTERRPGTSAAPVLLLRDVAWASIRGCRPAAASPVFLLLQGNSSRVSVMGNDLTRVEKPFQFGPGLDSSVTYQSGNFLK
ncbi:MAG: hypothetical protein A3F83_13685 [Candidatus Glassbacteria bacterium RIFCSPLOWO2_12_FULL_58_11]|uniref:Uncharacterized protein n=1 Tax=Candidatus Glassbacteria bacterium RIFCSPLOWO2_12_FULL_58_11 TaxID=1817867 RepID=A0A1F5YWZ0_9BACT|nr:MAG: hypothetical protein A3F83_13685 [Candidatus Glassbacteria bacterium RIFCSPLOWO2_12_FULL_58_11]